MPVNANRPTYSESYSSWRKYDADIQTKLENNVVVVDHAESARENLKDAGSNLFDGVTLPFRAPFLDEGLLGGPVRGLGDRAGNTLIALSVVPGLLVGGVKNGLDAVVHGVVALVD